MTTLVRKNSAVALLVAGAMFMEQLDGTVIVTALPDMAASFGVAPVDLNVGMSAYLLTVAVFIPASGWMTDRFGGRMVFAWAIALFTFASILCAVSTSLWAFTAARVLQGIGGALAVPVGRLVVLRTTEQKQLIRAIALLTWPALVAPVLGPPLGGLITTYSSWHWIFLINVPIGIVGFVLALFLVPSTRADSLAPFDWRGFVSTGTASFALMYSLESIGHDRVRWLVTGPLMVLAGCAGLYAWRHARTTKHPLLDLTAFRVPTFALSAGSGGLPVRGVIMATPFLLPMMFQTAFGFDPFTSGMLVLALFAGNIFMKPATTSVLVHFGFRRTLVWNGLIAVGTIAACGFLTARTSMVVVVILLFVSGLARSMQFTTLNTLSFADFDKARVGGANTLFSMLTQMSSALGIAVAAIVLRLSSLTHPDQAAITVTDFHVAFWTIGLIGLFGVWQLSKLPPTAGDALRAPRIASK